MLHTSQFYHAHNDHAQNWSDHAPISDAQNIYQIK